MSLLGNIWVKLGLKSDDFNKGLDNAEKRSKTFGETMKGIAAKVTAVVAAFKMLASTTKIITNFEAAQSRLAAVLGTTVEGIGRMTDSAIELGRKTQYTASQVTDLQTELAKLGFAEGDILSMQESVLKFAAAVGTDLASAAARAGATMRGFGLTAEQTSDMLNVMAVSTSKSALSFNYLDSTLGKLVPVAKTFGLDTEGTIALLGTLANAGIDASSAGTSLRNIMLKLADSSSDLNKQLGGQPKTTEELIKAFEKLRQKEIGLDEAAKLVDVRSASMFLTLVNGADDVADLYGELQNANGALDEMYSTMTHNVQGAVAEVKSAWEGFVLSLRGSSGILYTVLANVRDLINDLNYALFQSAKESTQTSRYYEKFSNYLKESADNINYLDANYKNLLRDAQQRVTDLEEKSALGRLLDHDSLEEARAEVVGITAAYTRLKGELEKAGETKETVIPTKEDDDALKKWLESLTKELTKEKEKRTGLINELREEIKAKEELRDAAQDRTEIQRLTEEISLLQTKLSYLQKSRDLTSISAVKTPTGKAQGASSLGIDTSGLQHTTAEVDAFIEKFHKQQQTVEDISQGFSDALRNGLINGLDELATCIGTKTWDTAALAKAIISPLADMAISAGIIISGLGEAIESMKISLRSLNGPVAIAAGVALIAAGVMAKAGLAALAAGGKGSGTSSSYSNPYTYAGGYGSMMATGYGGAVELQGHVTVKGQDLDIALTNYQKNKGR